MEGSCPERDFWRTSLVGSEQDFLSASGLRATLCSNKCHSVTELCVSVTSDCQNEQQEMRLIAEPNSVSRRFQSQDIPQLVHSVHDNFQALMDKTIRERGSSDMVSEILHHWTVAKSLCLNMVGRLDKLQLIREYIIGETVQPLILAGEIGTGKSTVMAQAAIFAHQLLSSDVRGIQSTVMIRFCGRTYDSQRSPRLICSLAEQFLCAADRETEGCSPWHREAKRLLGDVLRNGDYRGLLVVFVDAINELSSAEDLDDFLDWLPARIANNVKVIVSCESKGRTLERLRQKVTNQANVIQIGQLSTDHCIELLTSLLERSARQLTVEQRALIEHAFDHCQLSLYVHLLHDKLSNSIAFVDFPKEVLEGTVERCVLYKFKSLEETYGGSLTANALGLLVAESDGLSDCEMEGILSLKDDELKEMMSGAGDLPSKSRCSSMTWTRFRNELKCYLAVEDVGGFEIVRFANRSFTRIAETRYANSPSSITSLHSLIVNYFLGISGPSFFETTAQDKWKCSRRKTLDEPMYFNRGSERPRLTYRKLDLLPTHLFSSGRFRELLELVYFNFDWIYAKLVARSTRELLADFRLAKDPEAKLVAEAIALSEPTLAREPRLLGVELKGRLFAYHATHDRIRSLLDQSDRRATTLCPLVPLRTTFAPAGASLQTVVSITGVSSLAGFTVMEDEGRLLLAQKAPCDERMRVWNVTSGERQADVVLTSGSDVFLSPDGKFGSIFRENTLRIYHLESGDLHAEIEYGLGSVNCTASAGRYFAFGLDQVPGPVVVDVENGLLLRRLQYRSRSLAISHDRNYFACNSGDTLALHSLPLFERKATIPLSAVAEKLAFSQEPGAVKIYAMLGDRSIQAVTFQTLKRTGSAETLFQDIDLKDFKLSHRHNNLRILVRLSRSLYLLAVPAPQRKLLRLQTCHSSLDSDHSTTFLEAGFSLDDRLIMAIRGPYLGVWDASSAQLIRVLSSSEAPLTRLHSLETANSALTIGSDCFACLWNLDRLTTEQVASRNHVVRGEVKHIAAATAADRFICAGANDCVLAVGSLASDNLEHFTNCSNNSKTGSGSIIEYIAISSGGKFAVARISTTGLVDSSEKYSSTPEFLMSEDLIVEREDVIFDLTSSCRIIYRVKNSIDAVFSLDETKIAFIVSTGNSLSDRKSSTSKVVLSDLEKGKKAQDETNLLDNLHTDGTISKAIFTIDCSSLVLVCVQRSSDGNSYRHQLGVYSFEKHRPGLRYVDCAKLTTEDHHNSSISKNVPGNNKSENAVLVDVRAVKDAVILITVDVVESLAQTAAPKPLQDTQNAKRRLAVLYDLRGDSVLNRIEPFLLPFSDVESTFMLQHGTMFVDNRCNIFKVDDTCERQGTLHVGHLKLDIDSSRDLCFVLNGRYAVAIVGDGTELALVRTEDGMESGHLETHRRATVIAACSDDRSVLVGCEDGGILEFTVVTEEENPVSGL